MMALEQLYLESGMNKVEFAIDVLQTWEPEDGYYLAFSGGKDSVVIYDLAQKAEVKFDAHYCVSPIDPPQIYKFIKEYYPDVIWDYYAKGFWKTVAKRQLPRRQSRWCCELIKEAGGYDRVVIVGNRHAESPRRSHQCFVDIPDKAKTKKQKAMNKTIIRPILHFTDHDVWDYIRINNISYCSLYDEGARPELYGKGKGLFKRIGCVLCPFSSKYSVKREMEYFPKIVNNWRKVCDPIVQHMKDNNYIQANGKPYKHKFQTGEELFNWWVSRK